MRQETDETKESRPRYPARLNWIYHIRTNWVLTNSLSEFWVLRLEDIDGSKRWLVSSRIRNKNIAGNIYMTLYVAGTYIIYIYSTSVVWAWYLPLFLYIPLYCHIRASSGQLDFSCARLVTCLSPTFSLFSLFLKMGGSGSGSKASSQSIVYTAFRPSPNDVSIRSGSPNNSKSLLY